MTVTVDLDWAIDREPVAGEYMHFSGTSLKVEAVDWYPSQDLCHISCPDAIGHHVDRYLHHAGFRE
ncbi:MAG TPA: hypothetical protein VKF14_18945 [Candidatus Dormibacteraeota bacterium]|nr:hypothetical protein [Candidatus Dormibacteraeota bacterium]